MVGLVTLKIKCLQGEFGGGRFVKKPEQLAMSRINGLSGKFHRNSLAFDHGPNSARFISSGDQEHYVSCVVDYGKRKCVSPCIKLRNPVCNGYTSGLTECPSVGEKGSGMPVRAHS